MAISQAQLVDYLNKKLGYGVAKTDVATAKSPSNEGNASPLLSTADTIWQLSSLIPATIPTSNTNVVTVYNDALATTVIATVDPTVSITNQTWRTNLIDWIPPQFGPTYQVKVYAAPVGTVNPQTTGTQLFSDGSGNNDAWFFDYQAGILNFADTNVPTAVSGKIIYIVGARYTGQKGITNFPNGINLGNLSVTSNIVSSNYLFPNGQSILSGLSGGGGSYGNADVSAYLLGTTTITVANTTQASRANTGAFKVWGGASIGANLFVGGNLIVAGNSYVLNTEILTQNEVISGNIYAGAYFWSNGVQLSLSGGGTSTYSNANVAAYLPINSTITGIQANIGAFGTYANATFATKTSVQAISANLGAYQTYANATLSTQSINANLGAFQIYANANLGTATTNLQTLTANVGAYEIYANANLGTATNQIVALQINAAAQGTQISSLYLNANANTAAYLLQNPVGSITVGGTAQATTANTGAFRVFNGASIGGNLFVGGNLIVAGNTYELQTEILSQNQVVAGSVFAGAYFYSNGAPFGTGYGNIQVASYLTNYNGNIAVNGMTANTLQLNGTLLVANIVTAGTWGNITNANVISANTYVFASNGVNILTAAFAAIPATYSNANVTSYMPTYTGNLSPGSVFTNNYLFANGVSILTTLAGGNYGNANVTAYLPAHTGNISAGNILSAGNIISSGQVIQFINGSAGSGMISGNIALPVNNPYVFGGTYALSTSTPTTQNTAGNVALQLGSTSFAVQFWLYLTASPAANPIIFGKDQSGSVEYYATINTSGIYFSTTSGLQTAGLYNFTPALSTWYHIAWSSDTTNYRIYVNGQLVTTTAVSGGAITNGTSPLTIGASARGISYLNGYIEDFRIDKGTPGYTNTSTFPVPQNYLGTGPNTVFYLKSWNRGSGLSTTVDQTGAAGNFNLRMINAVSPATTTTSGPYNTITAGQGLLFDGTSTWYSTYNFQVQGNTAALSTTSGALQVTGGAGIQGNLYAGNIVTTGIAGAGTLGVSGNITVGNILTNNYLYPNGVSILTGIGGTYSNANVAAYLITNTGNITAGNIIVSTLNAANVQSGNIFNSGNITTGNVLSNYYLYPNGVSILTGISVTYGNSNVAGYLPTYSGNITAGNISTTGNVSANYLLGNLVSIGTSTIIGNLYTTGSGGSITGANLVSANTFTFANGVNILDYITATSYGNTQVTAYIKIDPTINGLQANLGSYQNTTNANIGSIFNGVNAVNANVGAYQTYANANATAQAVSINSLATNANANTAAYLLTAGQISVGSSTQATGVNTGAFRVTGGASVGANLYVGGNLVVAGNSYVLTTEILTQNEVISGNVYAGAYYWANGTPFASSSYGNTEVAAYLGPYYIYANANAATQATAINTLNANTGAFYIYANANIGSIVTSVNSFNANLGAYQTYANANAATLATGINTIGANVGAYENYSNIQFSSITSQIGTLIGSTYSNANVGAYLPTYSGTLGGDITIGGNLTVTGNTTLVYTTITTEIITGTEIVAGNMIANSGFISTSTTTGALQVNGGAGVTGNVNAGAVYTDSYFWANGTSFNYGNVQVAAYLLNNTGNISASNIAVTGNVVSGNVRTNGLYYANGVAYIFGSTYSNANVTAYLLTNTGNISSGNVLTDGLYYSNGVAYIFGSTYSNANVSAYLLTSTGNISSGNLTTDAIYYANGTPFNFGSTYSNANVASYLPTYSGNITAGNVTSRFYGNIDADTIIAPNGNLTLTPANNQIAVVNSSSALQVPKGPNSARPTGQAGFVRFNTDGSSLEFFDGAQWVTAVNSITNQTIIGNGIDKLFTLDQLSTSAGTLISINGTVQEPDVAYTISGTQINFAEAPLATDIVDVRFLVSASATIGDSAVVDSGSITVGTSPLAIDSWSLSEYRSAKYTISSNTASQSQMSDVFVTHNGTASFISNTTLITGADRINFTTSVVSGNVLLVATSTTTGNQVRIQRTYFKI
jgi:hypothetical protein